jgi:hypothetical protein
MPKKKKTEKKAPSKEKLNLLSHQGMNMKYRDLKRRAVILGMPFPDACSAGVFDLIKFINTSDNKPNKHLIDEYDEWMDQQLESLAYEKDNPLRSSKLRLGFLGEDENGEKKTRRVPGIRKPKTKKPPKERDEFNLIKGTKKSYVFQLVSKGRSLERTINLVKKKFPDANDKSISLWYRGAKRKLKDGTN